MRSALYWAGAALLLLLSPVWLAIAIVVVALWAIWQPTSLVLGLTYEAWLRRTNVQRWERLQRERMLVSRRIMAAPNGLPWERRVR